MRHGFGADPINSNALGMMTILRPLPKKFGPSNAPGGLLKYHLKTTKNQETAMKNGKKKIN